MVGIFEIFLEKGFCIFGFFGRGKGVLGVGLERKRYLGGDLELLVILGERLGFFLFFR